MAAAEVALHLSNSTSEAVRQAIIAPLRDYNQAKTGPAEHLALTIELRDAQGSTIGGLWGTSGYEWLFVQLLVVPEALRGQGHGRRMMQLAENEATRRGCRAVWLDTFEFQARGFYSRLGYECFGQLDDYPTGFARYFMRKTLTSPEASH